MRPNPILLKWFSMMKIAPFKVSLSCSAGMSITCPESPPTMGTEARISKIKFELDKLNPCLDIIVAEVKLWLENDSWIAVNTSDLDNIWMFCLDFVEQLNCFGYRSSRKWTRFILKYIFIQLITYSCTYCLEKIGFPILFHSIHWSRLRIWFQMKLILKLLR